MFQVYKRNDYSVNGAIQSSLDLCGKTSKVKITFNGDNWSITPAAGQSYTQNDFTYKTWGSDGYYSVSIVFVGEQNINYLASCSPQNTVFYQQNYFGGVTAYEPRTVSHYIQAVDEKGNFCYISRFGGKFQKQFLSDNTPAQNLDKVCIKTAIYPEEIEGDPKLRTISIVGNKIIVDNAKEAYPIGVLNWDGVYVIVQPSTWFDFNAKGI